MGAYGKHRKKASILSKMPPELVIKIEQIKEKNGIKTRTEVMRFIAKGLDPENFVIPRKEKKKRKKMFYEL